MAKKITGALINFEDQTIMVHTATEVVVSGTNETRWLDEPAQTISDVELLEQIKNLITTKYPELIS